MRIKELIKLKNKFSQSAYIESMKLSWENLPTRHLSCLGLKGLINLNSVVFATDLDKKC